MPVFERPSRLRESAKAAVGALLVAIWWQFVRFTGPVEPVPCGGGMCPVLRPNWLVLGMAVAATLVGLDWVRSTVDEAPALLVAAAAGVIAFVGLDIARVFAGHSLTRLGVGAPLAIEFLAFLVVGLVIAGVGARAFAAAVRRLAG